MPTLLELAGATAPANHAVDGQSLVPCFGGENGDFERPLFWYAPLYDTLWGATPAAAIRQGRYKLIHHFGDRFDGQGRYLPGEAVELYDLRADLSESVDLVETLPELTRDLQAQLHAWMASLSAPLPGPNPHHDPAREFLKMRGADKPAFIKTRP